MATTLAWVAVILLLPFVILLWATESQQQRVRRLRREGWSQQRIADHLKITRYKVRRLLMS
jgi:DNA-binding transcriptional regulator LsrR (DeoR family)